MNFGTQGELGRIVFAEFRNDSGEEIPAFGCLRITGMTTRAGRNVLTVGKPNTYGSQHMHRFNGPLPCAIGAYGVCTASTEFAALYDTVDGTPAFGEMWGPRSGTWKLKKNTGGFNIVGNADTTNGIVIVQPAPMLTVHGKTDTDSTKNSSVNVSIYYKSSAIAPWYTDTGENFSATNVLGDIPANRDVVLRWENDAAGGYWEIIAGDVC